MIRIANLREKFVFIVLFFVSFLFFASGLMKGFFYYDVSAQENRPDLTLESVTFNDEIGLRYTVRNIGTASTGDYPQVAAVQFDWVLDNGSTQSISSSLGGRTNFAAGGSFTQTIGPADDFLWPTFFAPPANAIRLRLTVDRGNHVPETNEDNNSVEVFRLTSQTTSEDLVQADETIVVEEIEEELSGGGEEEPEDESSSAPSASDDTTSQTSPAAGSPDEPVEEVLLPSTDDSISPPREKFEPIILPGNPLYFFKASWRELRAAITFDPKEDAELRLRYANEKILEANILTNKGNADRAVNHIASYTRELQKVNEFTEHLKERDQEAAQKIALRAIKSQLKHQFLIGKVEQKASPAKVVEAKEFRTGAVDEIAKAIEQVGNPYKLETVLAASLRQDGSPFRSLHNLEVLKKIEEKVPAEAKDAIRHAQDQTVKKFVDQLEVLPDKHKPLLAGYTEQSGGDELVYLKALDYMKFQGVNDASHAALLAAKEKKLSQFDERMRDAAERNPKAPKIVLDSLVQGEIEDLRIIKELERKAAFIALSDIDAVKKEALSTWDEKVNAKDASKQKKELLHDASKSFSDITQVEVVKDISNALPAEKRFLAEEVRQDLLRTMSSQLKNAKVSAEEKNLLRKFAGTDIEDIKVIEEQRGTLGKAVAEKLLLAQVQQIEEYVGHVSEPQRIQILKNKIRTDAGVRTVIISVRPAFVGKLYAKGVLLTKQDTGGLQCPSIPPARVFPRPPYNIDDGTDCGRRGREAEIAAYIDTLEEMAAVCSSEAADELARFQDEQAQVLEQVNQLSDSPPSESIMMCPNFNNELGSLDSIEFSGSSRPYSEGVDPEYYTVHMRILRDIATRVCSQRNDIMRRLADTCRDMRAEVDWIRDNEDSGCSIDNSARARFRAQINGLSNAAENSSRLVDQNYDLFLRAIERYEDALERRVDSCPAERKIEFTPTKKEPLKELVPKTQIYESSDQLETSIPLPAKTAEPLKILEPVKTEVQKTCLKEYIPVCGADNITYTNVCFATQAKAQIQYKGECKNIIQTPTEPIKTEPVSAVCTKEYIPICGVNAVTYTNSCEAKRAGVAIQYTGECKPAAPSCSSDYAPVCGTDGKTYTNACFAKQAGSAVQYSGVCKTAVYQCSDGIDNDKDGYTDLKDPGCTEEKDNDETNVVIKEPTPTSVAAKPVISSFAASSASITKGQSVTLSWVVSDARSIILSPTKETLPASGKKTVTPSLTTTYTITAANDTGSVSTSVTITVK